jgi:hypothetical protein
MDDVYERFLSLAQRELSADDVRFLAPGESPPDASNVVVTKLKDGRHVVASFATAPQDGDALTRRLAMLASTFADALAAPTSERTKTRAPVVISLHEELKALAARARAHDVIVIDGDSPVVWGCASISSSPRARNEMLLRDVSDRELSAHDEPSAPAGLHAVPASDDSGPLMDHTAPTGVLRMAPPPAESAPILSHVTDADLRDPGHDHDPGAHDEEDEPEITRRAIASIRALPSLDLLHKGKHLRHVARAPADESSYLVLSFSSIYLLCLVFDGDFDELRAERAAQESLPRIERLVLALPPLDPDPQPMGGVVALRRPRQRR